MSGIKLSAKQHSANILIHEHVLLDFRHSRRSFTSNHIIVVTSSFSVPVHEERTTFPLNTYVLRQPFFYNNVQFDPTGLLRFRYFQHSLRAEPWKTYIRSLGKFALDIKRKVFLT